MDTDVRLQYMVWILAGLPASIKLDFPIFSKLIKGQFI